MKMTESMESFIIEINRIVVEKIKKSEKYKKTDNLILLIQAQEYSSLGPFNPNIQ
ncbi:MAG: hypothetical protein MJ219_00385 [Mycoplasmoidaceae bacterium]|nr:hypothetical protein [Mycoplasmoidaceae bacterium]